MSNSEMLRRWRERHYALRMEERQLEERLCIVQDEIELSESWIAHAKDEQHETSTQRHEGIQGVQCSLCP